MPFEVTTTIVREVFRDAVIKLNEIESLGRLGDIATTYNSLAVLTNGVIPEDLASKLMVHEAILKFYCRMDIYPMDFIRFPLLYHIRRLHIHIEHLDLSRPFHLLSNLPALEEVTVLSITNAYWSDIKEVETWVRQINYSIPRPSVRSPLAHVGWVTLQQLTRSYWKFALLLSAEYWKCDITRYLDGKAKHVATRVCKVVVSNGRILEFEAVDPVGMEWRGDLIHYLWLDKEDVVVEVGEQGDGGGEE